jgi:hypothetical protein
MKDNSLCYRPYFSYLTDYKAFQYLDYCKHLIGQVEEKVLIDWSILYKWKKQLLIELETVDPRSIYWLYDPIGNTGKSTLAEELSFRLKQKVLIMGHGNIRDLN